ncbi:hypothetical protein KM043_016524 [Ampulex compressa]|nr:hypothetical protein KM043_016524 [Ampulex compressa]
MRRTEQGGPVVEATTAFAPAKVLISGSDAEEIVSRFVSSPEIFIERIPKGQGPPRDAGSSPRSPLDGAVLILGDIT